MRALFSSKLTGAGGAGDMDGKRRFVPFVFYKWEQSDASRGQVMEGMGSNARSMVPCSFCFPFGQCDATRGPVPDGMILSVRPLCGLCP